MLLNLIIFFSFITIVLAFYWIIFKAKGDIISRTLALAFIATVGSAFIEQPGGWVSCGGRGFPLPYTDYNCSNFFIVFIIDFLIWIIPSGFIISIKEGLKETLGTKRK